MTITAKQALPYLPDRPVEESNKDYLWHGQYAGIRDEIRRIAQNIIKDLPSPSEAKPSACKRSKSMTFAIFGKWGIGKSSALGLLEGEIRDLDQGKRVVFCRYEAPRYETASNRHEALHTLTYRIIQELCNTGEEEKKELIQLLQEVANIQDLEDIIPKRVSKQPGATDQAQESVTRSSLIQQRITEAFFTLIAFDKPLAKFLNDQRRILVVMIDDLDRCQKLFIWQVLNAIQALSSIDNLFFVLAVDQARLQEAIKEQTQTIEGLRDPGYALEKYIQQYVTLPPIDTDLLKEYIRQLEQDTPDPSVLQLIEEGSNAQILFAGLREVTPRSVKRFLNACDSEIERRLRKLEDEQKDRPSTHSELEGLNKRSKLLKEILMEYSWRDFYIHYLEPALKAWGAEESRSDSGEGGSTTVAILQALENICREYTNQKDSELLRFRLKRLADQYREQALASLDDNLMKLLGTPPFWILQEKRDQQKENLSQGREQKTIKASADENPKTTSKDITQQIQHGSSGKAEGSLTVTEPGFANGSKTSQPQPLAQATIPSQETEADPKGLFKRLYIHSQANENNREASLRYAAQILKLVSEHRESFDADQASEVGNVAIDAERFGDKAFAEQLYRLALDLDPEHSNNIQNYVDFILNARLRYRYEEAEQLLQKLGTGLHAQHRPERTLLLKTRLANLKGVQTKLTQQDLEEVVEMFRRDPSNRKQFSTLMLLLKAHGELKGFTLAREVAKLYYQHAADDPNRYLALRWLADTLAASSESRDEYEAMDLYRFILDHIQCKEKDRDLPDIQHNYAILLYKYDYDNAAGEKWFEAYTGSMSDRNIQRSYSDYLLRAGRADLAEMVIDGKPLPDKALIPEQKKLPERFSDRSVELLWEQPRETGIQSA